MNREKLNQQRKRRDEKINTICQEANEAPRRDGGRRARHQLVCTTEIEQTISPETRPI